MEKQQGTFLLLIGLLAVPQFLNLSHTEGLQPDFSNLLLQIVQPASPPYYPDFDILQYSPSEWAYVSLEVPEGDYAIGVLAGEPSVASNNTTLLNVTYFPGLLPDFSNLAIEVVENDLRRVAEFSILAFSPSEWAVAEVAVPPADYSLDFFAADVPDGFGNQANGSNETNQSLQFPPANLANLTNASNTTNLTNATNTSNATNASSIAFNTSDENITNGSGVSFAAVPQAPPAQITLLSPEDNLVTQQAQQPFSFEADAISCDLLLDSPNGTMQIQASRQATALFDFSSAPLGDGWEFIGLNNTSYSLGRKAGHLTLASPQGMSHDLWTNPSSGAYFRNAAHVLRDFGVQDATFEIKMDGEPFAEVNRQTYGLMLWQDDDNFLRFEFRHQTRTAAEAYAILGNRGHYPGFLDSGPIVMGNESNYLRVTRAGNEFSMEYSLDGSSWKKAGSYSVQNFTIRKIGLHAINAGTNPETVAHFDYLKITRNDSSLFNTTVNLTDGSYSWSAMCSFADSKNRTSESRSLAVLPSSGNNFTSYNITYFAGLEPDFSNLRIQFVSPDGSASDVKYTALHTALAEWAVVRPDHPPSEGQTVSFLASARISAWDKAKGNRSFSTINTPLGGKLVIADDLLPRLESGDNIRVIVKRSAIEPAIEVMTIGNSDLLSLADDGTVRIYPDLPMEASLNDTALLIGAASAQSGLNITGEGLTVCLLDSGVDFSLPSLSGTAVSGFDFVNNDSDASDDNGHGTFMASSIHAIAPNATILSVKVLNAAGFGYSSDIISGIDYCRSLAGIGNIRVISMSFGGGNFDSYCNADPVAEQAELAISEGLLAAASTGNQGAQTVSAPACAQNVTAVSSASKQDNVSPFSNMNGMVDLLAPGESVTGYGMGGTEQTKSGTSISAAHASGAAALLFQSNGSLSPHQAEARLMTTGRLIDYNGANFTRLNVYNAIINNFTGFPTHHQINFTNGTSGNSTAQAWNCGVPISESITMTGDLTSSGTCANFDSLSSLTFDCAGFQIQGDGTGYGFYMRNADSNIIQNCRIDSFGYGIFSDGAATNNLIYNSNISNSVTHGIHFENGDSTSNYFENVTNEIDIIPDGGTMRFYSDSSQSIDSVGNRGWWPLLTGDGSAATVVENTAHYGGPSGGYDYDGTPNANNKYWYNNQGYVAPPLSCSNLSSSGTTYNMTSNLSSSGATCFNVRSSNIVLDCLGYSITGNGAAGTYGIFSNASGTTLKNCILSNFPVDIALSGASNSVVQNTSMGTPVGLLVNNTNNSVFANLTYTNITQFGILLSNNSHRNNFTNFSIQANGGTGIMVASGQNNSFNCLLRAINGSNASNTYGIYSNQTRTSIANCTISNFTYSIFFNGTTSGNIIKNTFIPDNSRANNLVYLSPASGGNTFYWNNFTNTSGYFLNDTNGTNFYNSSASGANEGNIYHNMINGSVQVLGTSLSSAFPSLFIGSSGSGYPYNQTTSLSKFFCNFNGCADKAPLTPTTLMAVAFVPPTPDNNTFSSNTAYTFNASVDTPSFSSFNFTWNGSTYQIFSPNLTLMHNFDNRSVFGENASSNYTYDASSYGLNGTCRNMGLGCAWTPVGRYGSALNFTGTSWMALDPRAFNFPLSGTSSSFNHAFEVWFKTSSVGGILSITTVGFAPGGAPGGYVPAVYINSSGHFAASLFYHGVGTVIGSTSPVNDGNWHHGMVTYTSGGNESVYIDGVFQSSRTVNQVGFNAGGYAYHLGAVRTTSWPGGNTTWYYFQGLLDEVRFYNRTFTSSEVREFYKSNLYKFNASNWTFTSNQSSLPFGIYNYSACATTASGQSNCTGTRVLNVAPPLQLSFVSPTPANGTSSTNTSYTFNASMNASSLSSFNWTWNGSTHNFYNSSLVLHYNFDNVSSLSENSSSNFTHDASLAANHGACRGGNCNWTSTAAYGKALSFNGSAATGVNAGNASSLNITGNITLEAWANPASIPLVLRVLAKDYTTCTEPYNVYQLGKHDSGNIWTFDMGIGVGGGSRKRAFGGTITTGNWTHLIGTYNGSAMVLYVNGVNVSTTSTSGAITSSAQPVGVGNAIGSCNGANTGFDGAIDEVRIYNRSMTAAEVQQHYISNLYKYTATNWTFVSNQSGLPVGAHNYSACATDTYGQVNCTGTRTLTVQSSTLSCSALSTAGTTYNMTANQSANGTSCFNVTAQNITLNCAGYTITGNHTNGAFGINTNSMNTTVKNCVFRQWVTSIYYNSSANRSTSLNNTIKDSSPPGTVRMNVTGITLLSSSNYINSTTFTNLAGGTGTTGANGNPPGNGSAGGTVAAIFLSFSTNNSIGNLTISSLLGGTGGSGGNHTVSGTGGRGGIGGEAYGLLLQNSSANSISGVTISGITGGIAGNAGRYSQSGSSGGEASALFLNDSSANNSLSLLTISQVYGGNGSAGSSPLLLGGTDAAGGAGGNSYGIYLHDSASGNNVTSGTMTQVLGGWGYSSANSGVGGAGGAAHGLYLLSSGNRFFLSSLNSTIGGTGGNGGNGVDAIGGNGGAGGVAYGAYFDTSDSNNITVSVMNGTRGGSGGNGGSNFDISGGNGGNGGSSFDFYLTSSSSSNFSATRAFNSSGGAGGAGGSPGGSSGSAGTDTGVYILVSGSNRIFSTDVITNSGPAFHIDESDSNDITLSNGTSNSSNALLMSTAFFNSVSHSRLTSTSAHAIEMTGDVGSMALNNLSVISTSGSAIVMGMSSGGITLANSTLTSNSTVLNLSDTTSSTIYNNTLISGSRASNLLFLGAASATNVFYWNNFTNTSGFYANASSSGNLFNTTINGSGAGNIWHNVINGSVSIIGIVASPFPNLYYGADGSGYPYNSTTSLGKVSANVTDFAPLTNRSLSQGTPILNSTYGTNFTTEDIACYNVSTQGAGNVSNNYDFRINGTSILSLNMPFNLQVTSSAAGAVPDYSTYENNGTLGNGTAGTLPAWTSNGKVGGAYLFDGIDDLVVVPDDASLDGGGVENWNEFSMETWFKVNSSGSSGTLISKRRGAAAAAHIYTMGLSSGDPGYLYCFIGSSTITGTAPNNNASSGCAPLGGPCPLISLNAWQHYVCTYKNGEGIKMYLNGTLIGTNTTASGTLRNTSVDVRIGARGTGTGAGDYQQVWNGTIDEAKIYHNHALSAEEILDNYNDGFHRLVSQELLAGSNYTCQIALTDTVNTNRSLSNQLTPTIPSCTVLSTFGATHNMTSNLSINGSTCFSIIAANVTLNCNGYVTLGNNTPGAYAAYVNASNVTIKNCTFRHWATAIYLNTSASRANITNNTIRDSKGGPAATPVNVYSLQIHSASNSITSNAFINLTSGNGSSSGTGDGGNASAIFLTSSGSNTISGNSISGIYSGNASAVPFTAGGSAGFSCGIYFASATSANTLSSNNITSVMGGNGALGADASSGWAGGDGGYACGIHFSSDGDSSLLQSNRITFLSGGNGANGGSGDIIGGAGGDGGSANSAYFGPSSGFDNLTSNTAANFTGGAGGAGGPATDNGGDGGSGGNASAIQALLATNISVVTLQSSNHTGGTGGAGGSGSPSGAAGASGAGFGAHLVLTNSSAISSSSLNLSSYGLFVHSGAGNSFSQSNFSSNSVRGVWFGAGSSSNTLSSSYACFNSLDIENDNATNSGSPNYCDSFLDWTENGHSGCTFACTSIWHRFFGNLTGANITLGHSNVSPYIYSWNGANGLNVYMTDFDAVVSWQSLQAIGKNTTNGSSTNDFFELDAAFNSSSYRDNITATYGLTGSVANQTENYTVFSRGIASVPVAYSFPFNTTYKTGILWDASDGGTEYTNTINQTTVWVAKTNSSAASDAFGNYNFLVSIPYTLATYEGANSVVSIYAELQ